MHTKLLSEGVECFKSWGGSCLEVLIFLSLSIIGVAQNTPDWELYGGFQFANYHTAQIQTVVNSLDSATGSATPKVNTHSNMIGWNFSVQQNVNSWFSGIIDFSGGYGNTNVTFRQAGQTRTPTSLQPTLFTMGGGPQFTYRGNTRIQPFFRMICAAAYANLNPDANSTNVLGTIFPSPSTSETAFALLFGGGFDYRLKHYSSFRIAGDYLHSFVFNQSESNFRISAGVNFQIGNK
jgi:hypothetical protein